MVSTAVPSERELVRGRRGRAAAPPSRELFVLWDGASSGSGQPYVRLAMTPS